MSIHVNSVEFYGLAAAPAPTSSSLAAAVAFADHAFEVELLLVADFAHLDA